eukprot:5614640-Pleurochrysis_carterae.AAC.1
MQRLVPGIEFNTRGSRGTPFLIYADDGIIVTDSIHTLQLAMEVLWVMTKILGLNMQIKGKKKTAWSGVYYDEEGQESDITGWEITLPDGTKIPQLKGTETQKYLATQLRPGRAKGTLVKQMRKTIAEKSKRIIYAIGRLPGLTQKQLGSILALGVAGVLGYYARSTPMDMKTYKSIEEARVQVLKAAGYTTGIPRGQIYHAGTEGGMDTHEHAYGIAAAAYCDQVDRALCGSPEGMDHTQVAEALAETCYRLGNRGKSPLEWSPTHLLEELDDTRMMEAYIKYKLTLGIGSVQTKGMIHEALSRKRWDLTPRTPRLWEPDELVTKERKIKTGSITFHRALAEIGVAVWANIYDKTTKEYYTMEELCKRCGVKKNARIIQEYSNVKRPHTKQLQETEQGALGILWGRHKKDLLDEQEKDEYNNEILEVRGKRKTAECWGGEEYLLEWKDREQKWVNKLELQKMNGPDAALIHREREQSNSGRTSHVRGYAQRGDKGRSARENAGIDGQRRDTSRRESQPTLYPGKVADENESQAETSIRTRNMRGLTERAKANQYRRERKGETHENKRLRLAKGDHGTRRVSDQPEQRPGGGKWEIPTHKTDTEARELLGGYDGRGKHRVFKNEAMDIAHEEKYAGHPILRFFTRPKEMENGRYMRVAKEDVTHMNAASGKKFTYDTLNVALTLHERHTFHVAVATDGAKKGGTKVRGEPQKLSETTYG